MNIMEQVESLNRFLDESAIKNEYNELKNNITHIIESDESILSSLLELKIIKNSHNIDDRKIANLTFSMMRKMIKVNYALSVKKILSMSKELNDLYTKIEYLLKNDKMARFKHRNDLVDAELKNVLLHDNNDPRKTYCITNVIFGHNIKYIADQIDNAMNYSDDDIKKIKESIMKELQDFFDKNYWFTESCEPIIQTKRLNSVKLEGLLKHYEDMFSIIYRNIHIFDQSVQIELQNIQYTEQAYNRMLGKYGKNKEGKQMVDDIFKLCLKHIYIVTEFNQKIMDSEIILIKFYANELERMYEIIRE